MNSERKTKQTIARIIHRYRALLSVVAFVALIWGLTLYQKAPSSGGPVGWEDLVGSSFYYVSLEGGLGDE